MNDSLTRRRFLAHSGQLCGGVALASLPANPLLAKQQPTAWPVTCRDAMLRHTGQQDCWSAMQAIAADRVEAHVAEDLSLPGLFHPKVKYAAADIRQPGATPWVRGKRAFGQPRKALASSSCKKSPRMVTIDNRRDFHEC